MVGLPQSCCRGCLQWRALRAISLRASIKNGALTIWSKYLDLVQLKRVIWHAEFCMILHVPAGEE